MTNRNQPNVPSRPGPGTNVHRLRTLTGAAAKASPTGRTEPYSEEEREEVVALAERVGVKAASVQTGIPESMIKHFRTKAVRDRRAALAEYLREGGTLEEALGEAPSWREVRIHHADKLAQAAGVVQEQAVRALLEGNDRLAKAGAMLVEVFIRYAQHIVNSEPALDVRNMTPEQRAQRESLIIASLRRRVEANVRAQAEAVGLGDDGA